MRRVRQLLKTDPALAHRLRQALVTRAAHEVEPSRSVLRRADSSWEQSSSSGTEDVDVLRIEQHPRLPFAPVYSPEVQGALRGIVTEHKAPAALTKVGLTPTKTVLLSGPPGVGKSLGATWLAIELNKPLLVLDLATVMSRYLGATGANLSRAMEYALNTDGILFLDELDALAKRRDDTTDVGELKRLVTVLLQKLDGWPAGRLLIAATNHPQLLDNAVWRRFDERIDFSRPSSDELVALMQTLTPRGYKIPEVWKATLPIVFADTSHSEFVRAYSQLRKIAVLEPNTTAVEGLSRVIKNRMASLTRKDAKAISLAMARDKSVSLRQISELTHVSRDTMRRAGA